MLMMITPYHLAIPCHAPGPARMFVPAALALACMPLQGAYNKLTDQSCKRVWHGVQHNRLLPKVSPEDFFCV